MLASWTGLPVWSAHFKALARGVGGLPYVVGRHPTLRHVVCRVDQSTGPPLLLGYFFSVY